MKSSKSFLKTLIRSASSTKPGAYKVVAMSFFSGRVNYGKEYFLPKSGDEFNKDEIINKYFDNVIRGPGEILLQYRYDASEELINLTAKSWSRIEDGSFTNKIYQAGLPGWVMRPWILYNFVPKITNKVVDTIIMRRDYEKPLAPTKVDDVEFGTESHLLYRTLRVFLRWFNVYNDDWLWTVWNSPDYISLSTEDKFYDILFVKFPLFIYEEHRELMNYKTGDYDELLRCLRAVYSLTILSGKVEESFEEDVINDLRTHYTYILSLRDPYSYKLWTLPMAEDMYAGVNLLKIENALLGRPDRDPDNVPSYLTKTRMGINLLIDLAHLFKYIDVTTGSYFYFDVMVGRKDAAPLFQISREKRRVGMSREWSISFKVSDVWIDAEADLYVIYDSYRRRERRMTPKITETVLRSISKMKSFDFIELEDVRDALEELEERKAMLRIAEDMALLDPSYKSWLIPEASEERELELEFIQDSEKRKLKFTTLVRDRLEEYKLLAAHLYHIMFFISLPKMDQWRKVEKGVFSSRVNPKIKQILNVFVETELGLGRVGETKTTVGDYFYPVMVAIYNSINYSSFPIKEWKMDFFTLYNAYGRDKEGFLYIAKAVLTVLTGSPRISKYVISKIDPTLPPVYQNRQELVDEIRTDWVNPGRLFWDGEEILRELIRTSAYNVYKTDSILLKELLDLKL